MSPFYDDTFLYFGRVLRSLLIISFSENRLFIGFSNYVHNPVHALGMNLLPKEHRHGNNRVGAILLGYSQVVRQRPLTPSSWVRTPLSQPTVTFAIRSIGELKAHGFKTFLHEPLLIRSAMSKRVLCMATVTTGVICFPFKNNTSRESGVMWVYCFSQKYITNPPGNPGDKIMYFFFRNQIHHYQKMMNCHCLKKIDLVLHLEFLYSQLSLQHLL